MELPRAKLLLVDTEEPILRWGVRFLRGRGFSVETTASGASALALALKKRYDLVLLAWRLPGITGEQVLRVVRSAGCKVPVLVVANSRNPATEDEVFGAGANGLAVKPLRVASLAPVIDRLVTSGHTNQMSLSPIEDSREDQFLGSWTARLLRQLDATAPLPTAASDNPDSLRRLRGVLSRSLVETDATIPEFITGCQAMKVMVTSPSTRCRQATMSARRILSTPALRPDRLARRAREAVVFLESAEFGDYPLRAKVVADLLGTSQNYLGTSLADHTGLPWTQWAAGGQCRATLRRLASTNGNVSAVASACGWSSHERLCHTVHHVLGMTPTEIRAMITAV